jgi:hypothetical protein
MYPKGTVVMVKRLIASPPPLFLFAIMWKHAFSLSKAEVQAATPPGTIKIFHEEETGHASGFIKFPRPSADARDPLNFSRGRKTGALIVASVFAFVANFTSSVIAPALQLWPMAFPNDPRTYAQRSYLIAVGPHDSHATSPC